MCQMAWTIHRAPAFGYRPRPGDAHGWPAALRRCLLRRSECNRYGQGPSTSCGLFQLEEADGVVVGVGEPGGECEADVGDAVHGAQLGQVLDGDAARPQAGDFAGDVADAPGGLGGLVGGASGAEGDDEPAVAAEGEE